MKLLSRNHYSILITEKCNFSCSYCCAAERVFKNPPFGTLELNINKLAELFTMVDPGVIHLSGGEPFLARGSGVEKLMELLPLHYWSAFSNLSFLPRCIYKDSFKLIMTSFHDEFTNKERWVSILRELKAAGKAVVAKLIVRPDQEYAHVALWEELHTHGIPAHFVPLEYGKRFQREFVQDLVKNFLTSCLYNARFFNSLTSVSLNCIGGTKDMFEVSEKGEIRRCSTNTMSCGDIFHPKLLQKSSSCSKNCYCEWHHFSDVGIAHENARWDHYINTGTWNNPDVSEFKEFIINMGWSLNGQIMESSSREAYEKSPLAVL